MDSKPIPQRRLDRAITFLTQDEMRRLFSAIKEKRDRAIFAVAYRHGLRASEIGMLQTADVDLQNARITINRLKGSLSGTYPLSPDTVKLLRSYLRARKDDSPYLFISNRKLPIDRRTLLKLMQKYCKLAGIPEEKQKFLARVLNRFDYPNACLRDAVEGDLFKQVPTFVSL